MRSYAHCQYINIFGFLNMQLEMQVVRYQGNKVEGDDLKNNRYALPELGNLTADYITGSSCEPNASEPTATLKIKYNGEYCISINSVLARSRPNLAKVLKT